MPDFDNPVGDDGKMEFELIGGPCDGRKHRSEFTALKVKAWHAGKWYTYAIDARDRIIAYRYEGPEHA